MKYIVTKDESGKEEIFLFPNNVHHDAMAEVLNHIKNQTWGDWERVRRKPIAAGFIEKGECVGRSESLRLESRPIIDTALFNNALSTGQF
jgi:hypothetical protein